MDAPGRRSFFLGLLWLLLGSLSLLFMGGKWNIVAATWIGSIFLVRYFRTRRAAVDVLLAVPFLFAAAHVFLVGLAEQVTLAFRILIDAAFTLYLLVPCLVDGFLHGKKNVKRLGVSEVEISAEGLPKETEIWVLEPAL